MVAPTPAPSAQPTPAVSGSNATQIAEPNVAAVPFATLNQGMSLTEVVINMKDKYLAVYTYRWSDVSPHNLI